MRKLANIQNNYMFSSDINFEYYYVSIFTVSCICYSSAPWKCNSFSLFLLLLRPFVFKR